VRNTTSEAMAWPGRYLRICILWGGTAHPSWWWKARVTIIAIATALLQGLQPPQYW